MSKKILFWVIVTIVYSLTALVIVLGVEKTNDYRSSKSSELYAQSGQAKDAQEKLALLIQSDLLNPTDKKKLDIAKTLYLLNERAKAVNYLEKINCKTLPLACDYLIELGNERPLSYQLENEVINEYRIFNDINNGRTPIESISNAQTNPGKLLELISGKEIIDTEFIDPKTTSIVNSKENINTKIMSLIKYFNSSNRPHFAIYIIERSNLSEKEKSILLAESYNLLKQYEKSYELLQGAIKIDPSDISIYEKVIEISKQINGPKNIELIKENYNRLKALSK